MRLSLTVEFGWPHWTTSVGCSLTSCMSNTPQLNFEGIKMNANMAIGCAWSTISQIHWAIVDGCHWYMMGHLWVECGFGLWQNIDMFTPHRICFVIFQPSYPSTHELCVTMWKNNLGLHGFMLFAPSRSLDWTHPFGALFIILFGLSQSLKGSSILTSKFLKT